MHRARDASNEHKCTLRSRNTRTLRTQIWKKKEEEGWAMFWWHISTPDTEDMPPTIGFFALPYILLVHRSTAFSYIMMDFSSHAVFSSCHSAKCNKNPIVFHHFPIICFPTASKKKWKSSLLLLLVLSESVCRMDMGIGQQHYYSTENCIGACAPRAHSSYFTPLTLFCCRKRHFPSN